VERLVQHCHLAVLFGLELGIKVTNGGPNPGDVKTWQLKEHSLSESSKGRGERRQPFDVHHIHTVRSFHVPRRHENLEKRQDGVLVGFNLLLVLSQWLEQGDGSGGRLKNGDVPHNGRGRIWPRGFANLEEYVAAMRRRGGAHAAGTRGER
jgi:hypothetical protein